VQGRSRNRKTTVRETQHPPSLTQALPPIDSRKGGPCQRRDRRSAVGVPRYSDSLAFLRAGSSPVAAFVVWSAAWTASAAGAPTLIPPPPEISHRPRRNRHEDASRTVSRSPNDIATASCGSGRTPLMAAGGNVRNGCSGSLPRAPFLSARLGLQPAQAVCLAHGLCPGMARVTIPLEAAPSFGTMPRPMPPAIHSPTERRPGCRISPDDPSLGESGPPK
jgi:hypothetical protein